MKFLANARKYAGKLILLGVFVSLAVLLAGCELPTTTEDNSPKETTMALAIQATVSARDNESQSESDDDAQSESISQTAIAESVQATIAASQPTAETITQPEPTANTEAQPQPTATTEAQPQPTATTETIASDVSFDEWMKSANILVYEDMAGVFTISRYVEEALDRMGLDFVDVKDAMGRYKEQLLSGGPGGQGWDLIISAKEARGDVQGEFYVYLNDALSAGSSVIIEEWQLDQIGLGKISTILGRCGVQYQDNWTWDPLTSQLLWPVDGSNPIHHQPNEGIALTNPTGYWSGADLGDFMKLPPGSNATPLWVARVNVDDSFLTAVSCMDGQLIIQTYSTHDYGYERVIAVWQNYIYNTLYARYQRLHK